ncbi:MAG: ABC transporter permease [Salinivirgaceae bacterium]|nr:ABC transporter permease [Salinivirgaceae bacterium]
MIALKLAYKNLLGAGLRTWLNVTILSFAFVLIIFYNGLLDGWNRQGKRDTINWQTGQGQLWHSEYDPFDPYTIADSHAPLSDIVLKEIHAGNLSPILITQATAYPNGRVQNALLKGIDPNQKILQLPSADLNNVQEKYSAFIGSRMAEAAKLNVGDWVLVRWRDKNGTFDAREIQIAAIFKCDVPAADNGQIYISLSVLQEMMGLENEASILVSNENFSQKNIDQWVFKDLDFLLEDFEKLIASKKGGSMIMQGLLLILALLAIFDTQVLSIFRRQKEIGTYIALGLTRWQVVGIFTVEGGAHSILAALLGAVYGIPLFIWLGKVGISFGTPDMGITIAETIYPYYSVRLVIISLLIVVFAATVVSFLPARKIAKMKPTDALKGKLQ